MEVKLALLILFMSALGIIFFANNIDIKHIDAININKTENLPFLLKYYKDNFEMKNDSINFEKRWNNENNLDFEFVNLLKGELDKYVK